jgi:hypothetical protein
MHRRTKEVGLPLSPARFGFQQHVVSPQAARGWARSPCRHSKNQSCGRLFEMFSKPFYKPSPCSGDSTPTDPECTWAARDICARPQLAQTPNRPRSSTSQHAAQLPTRVNPPTLLLTLTPKCILQFSTHGQQSAAQGISTIVSRSDIRLIKYLVSAARGLARRVALD